jgi:hypothetical protein
MGAKASIAYELYTPTGDFRTLIHVLHTSEMRLIKTNVKREALTTKQPRFKLFPS